jgi:hypothetical protein
MRMILGTRRAVVGAALLLARPTVTRAQGAAAPVPCPTEATSAATIRLCGVVRDARNRPVAGAEVVAALEERETRTDSAGVFRLSVPANARGVLLTVRALGFAPQYRTIATAADTVVIWHPVLRSVQRLAAQRVEAAALPAGVPGRVSDEVGPRYARGIGQFLIGEQLWQTSDLGAALGRVPGLEVYGGRAGTIQRIGALRCNRGVEQSFEAGRIGVFVNGVDQTSRFGLIGGLGGSGGEDQRAMAEDEAANRRAAPRQSYVRAEEVLSEFRVGELSAIEVYRGRGEIPGVFANPDYCAVISVWTR